jgi:valyl-tRNA synthetase
MIGEQTGLASNPLAFCLDYFIKYANLVLAESLPGKPEGHIALVVGPLEIYLPLAGLVDLAEERARLQKELGEASSHIERLEKLLDSPFAQNAPPPVVQKEREKLENFRETAEKLKAQLDVLG